MGKRRYAKRKTRQTFMHQDTVMENLRKLHVMFAEDHEDLAEFLRLIAQMELQVQERVRKFYELAWGSEPSDWYMDRR